MKGSGTCMTKLENTAEINAKLTYPILDTPRPSSRQSTPGIDEDENA